MSYCMRLTIGTCSKMFWFYIALCILTAVIVFNRKMDILMWILRFNMFLLKMLMYPYRLMCSFESRKMCPPVKNHLLLQSAKKLAYMIRTKQVTSEEVIRSYIARIQEVNPVVNAVVDSRFDEAIAEAKEVDKFLQITRKTERDLETDTPLLGVPITVKESIAVAGMSNAAGVWHNEIPRAGADAEIVQLVKYAGAIPLCVTNTPELCVYWESFNNVTGLTRNPYDTRRTVGGSSGGEAALLSSAASVIGLGSDICGSLRLPPHFTGVYGHKPSPEIISIQGHVPGCDDEKWSSVFVLGPMTRYAEDMALLFPIVTMPEVRKKLRLDEPVSVKRLKFYYMEIDTNRETILAMRNFASYLRNEYGIIAQKVEIKHMENSVNLFNVAIPNMIPMDHVHCLFYNEDTKTYSIWKHVLKKFTCMSKVTMHVIMFGIILVISNIFQNKKPAAGSAKEKIRNELKDLLGDDGVLLFPSFTNVAHFHKEVIHKVLDSCYYTIFNVLELPVTQCPLGYNSNGLPFGVQVVANRDNDRLTIAVAQEIEKAFGGWRPPASSNEKNVVIDNFVL